MGETWQHISELEERFAEKSNLLSTSQQTTGNHNVITFPKPFPIMEDTRVQVQENISDVIWA